MATRSNLQGREQAPVWHGAAEPPANDISREVVYRVPLQTDGPWLAASLRTRAASRPPLRSPDGHCGTTDGVQMAVPESVRYV